MNESNRQQTHVWQKLWIAIRFILFGVGGFWLLTYSWVSLLSTVLKDPDQMLNPYLAAPLVLAGSLSLLFGGGAWGRWAYLYVFFATPVTISVFMLFSRLIPSAPSAPGWSEAWGIIDPKLLGVLVFTLPTVISYAIVRRYYRRRHIGTPRGTQESSPIPARPPEGQL